MKEPITVLTPKSKTLQRGAELVEVAITLSFFLILFLLIIDGVRLAYTFISATYLVNDAVRYTIVRGADAHADDPDNLRADVPATVDSIKNYLKNNDLISLQNQNIGVVFADGGSNEPGSRIQIAINYPFVPVLPVLEKFGLALTIPVSAEGVIVY